MNISDLSHCNSATFISGLSGVAWQRDGDAVTMLSKKPTFLISAEEKLIDKECNNEAASSSTPPIVKGDWKFQFDRCSMHGSEMVIYDGSPGFLCMSGSVKKAH